VRAKMRNMIRIILRRFKYPPDNQAEAMKLVMEQAEALSDEWTSSTETFIVQNNCNYNLSNNSASLAADKGSDNKYV
ncbi:MAG: DUF3387 domain-containing protein, partial [Campylobacterota bacterium]|nr:DUF3387 domain-containing protein [Campylobacterota bacterium]